MSQEANDQAAEGEAWTADGHMSEVVPPEVEVREGSWAIGSATVLAPQ
jgi:hypothetical protein